MRFPLDWRREHKITKNSFVRIVEQENGCLLVIPPDAEGDQVA